MKNSATLPRTIAPFVWHFLKPYKIYMIGFVACAVVSGLFTIIFSTLLKIIIDTIDTTTSASQHSIPLLQLLFWPSIGFIINFEIHNTMWRLMNCINYKIQPLIKNNIIQETFNYVTRHYHQFFQDQMAGKLSNNVTILANSIERSVHDLSRHIIRGAVMVCAIFITLYLVHPDFFWCFLIWAVLFGIGSFWASQKSISLVDHLASTESAVSGNLVDSISNIQNIRYFSMFNFESSYLLKTLSLMRLAFRKKEKFMIIYWSFQGISQTAMLAVMAYLLINLRQKGLVSAGDFALILTLCTEVGFIVWWTMEQIDNLNDTIGKCNQSLRALFA
ncbi:MAG: ABC transporter transmembrane domain-containing protein, partial [Alphaproteobacteria bacterium]|nr:ABC transporter transmembrane domain-containing protein [Alphaproteobacteria bacterium]